MAGLAKCMQDLLHFDFFGDEFTMLTPHERDGLRKRALKRFLD